MKYYKLLNYIDFIGVATSFDLRKYQTKHGILLTSDEQAAQYIQFDGELYRDDWFAPVVTGALSYNTVKIVAIEKDEYDILFRAIEAGKEIKTEVHEPEVQKEEPQADPVEEVTIDFVKKSKISEMSAACQETITQGFDIILSDGKSHHFSLTVQDQLNLITLSSAIAGGETQAIYHADGELCREFSADDITKIFNAADAFKTYHLTYYNALKGYIGGMDSIEEIGGVDYGMDIPEDYMTEALKKVQANNNKKERS